MYAFGDGRGTVKAGFLAERVDSCAALDTPIPNGLDDAVAAACGVAGIAG